MTTTPTLTPHEFVSKWRGDTRKERSVSQEHFIDLCRLIGHQTPGDNRDGTLAFEAGASKSSGGQGWADVWKKNHFAWEYKGPDADLVKAYAQLQQYRDALQNPPLLVVSDIQTIVIHTNFVNTVKRTTTLSLDDLLTPGGLQTLRSVFTNPEALRPTTTTHQVTEEAAREFAKLASLLQRYGEEPQPIAHFLIRLLFCLFAEDTGLLPGGLFTRIIAQTRHRTPEFVAVMKDLFSKMAIGGYFGMERIRHFNGSLFENDTVLALDSEGMDILERVSALDWGSIEPSIFGTLFERSLDPSKRSQLGAHYTSREDIMLIVEPVLMAPLRRKWVVVQEQARKIAAQRDATSGQSQRGKRQNELTRVLVSFIDEIAGTWILDPACGSGNFLYVALKQLLDLEQDVINLGADLGLSRMSSVVGPEQLFGIEINEYAHELAQVTVWIGYLQWLSDHGLGIPEEPILQSLDTIKHMDAILAFDAQGKPYEPEWPKADVIIGNPPFLGGKRMRRELGDYYVNQLRQLYLDRVPGDADLVCYWFEKSRSYIVAHKALRVGLLATQAIRGGLNRRVLERIKETGDIFWAYADWNWVLDGATVHVSMIGFDNGEESERWLDGYLVKAINTNLSSNLDVSQAHVLPENSDIAFVGVAKGGPFELSNSQAQQMLRDIESVNGQSNHQVIRQSMNGADLVGSSRGMWIIDFGISLTEREASEYHVPFDYIYRHVKPYRVTSSLKDLPWWIHQRPRPGMRRALQGLQKYIGTPLVSKHRIFAWISAHILPDQTIIVIAREDDYFLGVVHSKLHEVWTRSKGTQLREAESGFRYSQSTTFETFPFPWAPGTEDQADPRVVAIASAAKRLVELRNAWLNPPDLSEAELKKRTLTNLYNARPDWLAEAHSVLDRAVADAYGWPHDLSDEQILERLLALNLERAAHGGVASGVAKVEEDSED